MTDSERLVADYAGMGLTIGRHPMALRRDELAMRGIRRAIDLRTERQGRGYAWPAWSSRGTSGDGQRLRVPDTRGRDRRGQHLVRPDLFARERLVIVDEPFLVVDGVLQNQDGVMLVRAERISGMRGIDVEFDAHDFY